MNHHMQNAQKDLKRRRPYNGGAAPIGDIKVAPGTNWTDAAAPPPSRAYELKPLSAFTFDHLNTIQVKQLKAALILAETWMVERKAQPGLSFVLSGPVGTGKTTIAENLIQPFRRTVGVKVDDDDTRHVQTLRTVMNQLDDDTQKQALAREIADFERFMEPCEISSGILLEATPLMRLIGDQMPLSYSLNRYDVIIVDDAGREDFSTPSFLPDPEHVRPIRQTRYGRLFDYCYRTKKHILVTSNVALKAGEGVNPTFIDIFGDRAFDRLYQMARGFMVDLGGLPSYRQYVVREA